MRKLTKAEKARLGVYTELSEALEAVGIEVIGKTKEGLVIKNDADSDEAIVIKAIVKKNAIDESDIEAFVTLEQKQEQIKAFKAKQEADKNKEDEA